METGFVSFRSDRALKQLAGWLAKLEQRGASDEYRSIFAVGVVEKRKQLAVERYAKGQASFGQAAELAGVSAWEFLELLRDRRVPLNLTAEDVLEAAEAI